MNKSDIWDAEKETFPHLHVKRIEDCRQTLQFHTKKMSSIRIYEAHVDNPADT